MVSPVSVVVGASRGIGLELAKVLHSNSWEVYATCRREAAELSERDAKSSSFHTISGVDVETEEGCTPLATLACSSIDLVVCNAGVLTNDTFDSISFSDCAWQFNTNALGPLRAIKALMPKLSEGSKVVVIGSKLGSFGATKPGTRFGYRMSKCAAHMAARCLAEELKPKGIAVCVMHPGVVQTDMVKLSGSIADVTPENSAAGIFKVIGGLSMHDTGSFYNYLGEPMAW
eukprot:jgi/Ulvmu1/5816/UM025_0073.1